ncbi:MAG: amidohydrolase [Acetobacteraceae bacterium]|nr:amidohydrolase [Acetobacteraceae bacterium]
MPAPPPGGIDCDVHPAVPSLASLLPHMPRHWAEQLTTRGMHELHSAAYPNNAPLTARPDWRPDAGLAGASLDRLRTDALDAFGSRLAICNCLYGVQLLFSEDMAAAYARAVNEWLRSDWLDREPRLRANIVVAPQSPALAAEEIERCAADPRFVGVLMLVMDEMPLGRRHYWPIYQAAARHRLPVSIHAGSAYKHPVTTVGWPTYYTEDYAAQATAFQSLLTSLIAEGVFNKFPDLKVVLLESGVTWLPAHLWRLGKYWHGLRIEIPWVDRAPLDIVRSNVRLSIQPFDAPAEPGAIERIVEHLRSDELLLFATDYPHWHFDGTDALPPGLSPQLARKITVDNPLDTYARLQETVT